MACRIMKKHFSNNVITLGRFHCIGPNGSKLQFSPFHFFQHLLDTFTSVRFGTDLITVCHISTQTKLFSVLMFFLCIWMVSNILHWITSSKLNGSNCLGIMRVFQQIIYTISFLSILLTRWNPNLRIFANFRDNILVSIGHFYLCHPF